jgi:peptide/nickel transport system ATP-binding protein
VRDAAADEVLQIRNLSVALPISADRAEAVSDVTLDLRRNEIVCVVGESGSGKSVMCRAVMGLLPAPHVRASGGRIVFHGDDLLKCPGARLRDIRGKRISMIFQEPMSALNPVKTIGRQIEEVLVVHTDLPRTARRRKVIEQLAAVNLPGPEHIFQAYPHQLSGGQRQRAMIAMALILEPEILIADEPTTALDVTTQAQILKLIRTVQHSHRMAVLFVTHDFGVVADIADRVAVMQQGKLVELGEAREVLNAPGHPYTRQLIAAVPKLTHNVPARTVDGPVVLATSGLTKIFRSGGTLFSGGRVTCAVENVSLSLRRGETLGVVGESGSGKSTLARCLTRLVQPDAGSIRLNEVDITSLSRRQLRGHRRHMQMVFQDPYGSLDPRQRVGDAIAEGPMVHGLHESEAKERAQRLLELVGLDVRAADRFPHEFSGGQRQRICVARALALEPAVLIADEVVSALDVSVQAQVLRLLADIKHRLRLAMLFITHDLRVAAQVCDSLLVMRNGAIVESGWTADVFSNPSHPYTQELLAAVPGREWLARSPLIPSGRGPCSG